MDTTPTTIIKSIIDTNMEKYCVKINLCRVYFLKTKYHMTFKDSGNITVGAKIHYICTLIQR